MIKNFTLALLSASAVVQGYQDVHSEEYLSLSAAEKSDRLWENIFSDGTTPGPWTTEEQSAGIFIESMDPTFDMVGDEMGECIPGTKHCRTKFIHSVGTVASAYWLNT